MMEKISLRPDTGVDVVLKDAGFRQLNGNLYYVRGSDGAITAGCGWDRGGEFSVIAVVGQEIEVYSLADAVMDKLIEDR